MTILLWKSSSLSSIHNPHYFSIRREIGALQIKCGMKIGHSERTSCLNKRKEISAKAGLSRTYTNHSVRATAITLWANAGLTDREVMAISGHCNEASLRSYHNQPSVNQHRKCSDVLTVALCEDKEVQTSAAQQSTATRSPFQQLPCTSSTMNMNSVSTGMAHHSTVATSTAYSNMFNSCKIGSVNITFLSNCYLLIKSILSPRHLHF